MTESTLGIDLASNPSKTAVCRIVWSAPPVIEIADADWNDDQLEKLILDADKVGIDVPLGWPLRFVHALHEYMSGGIWEADHLDADLRLRATDQHVAHTRGRNPLSVSTNLIAIPAMRAARLLSRIDSGFDRSGSGRVVEVYPALSLKAWRIPNSDRYKGRAGEVVRRQLVDSFSAETAAWMTLDASVREKCVRDDNVFDALICALTARAAQLGLCEPIPKEHSSAARLEGWIALPVAESLARLALEADDEDDLESYLLPARDPDHPCPRCGSAPWAPADGFGRMCDWCGWTWEIDQPDDGHFQVLGPSPETDAALKRLLAVMQGSADSQSSIEDPAHTPCTAEDFALWIQLRHSVGIKEDPAWADAAHSNLLARISRGGPIFRDPPPLRYSYPWVELCSQGWDLTETPTDSGGKDLAIAQFYWGIDQRYERHGRPAWRVQAGPWTATVEWEGGQLHAGGRHVPPSGGGYVVRLTAPALLIGGTVASR